jgi:thymidylate synthase
MITNEQRMFPIFSKLQDLKIKEQFVQDKSGVKLVEILNMTAELNPSQPYFNYPGKKTSEEYVKAELDWYNSLDLSVDFIGQKAKIWTQICSEDNLVNSNYGWCIFSIENGEQYKNCFVELIKNPASRRAIMIYTRPSMHVDYCRNGMNDFICTNTVQCFIRDNKLKYIVNMRSNDAIFGFFNDFVWHCHVYMKLLEDIRKVYPEVTSCDNGIYWNAASFHVYERHFEMLDKICEFKNE